MRKGACFLALLALAGCKDKYREAAESARARDAGSQVGPMPERATLLAHGQNVPRDLQLDGQNLYWLNEGRRAEGTPGIYRIPKSGGEVSELVSGRGIHAIAVDDVSVYFLHPEQGTVSAVPKLGGEARTLASEQENLGALAVDDSHVYWTATEGIFRVEKAGGKVSPVVNNLSQLSGLSVDDSHVYWYALMAGKLARAPKKGGPPTQLVSEEVTLHSFFIDQGHLYWSFGSEKKAQLKRMAKSGGRAEQVVAGQEVPAEFAFDDGHVYWNTESEVFRAPKSGGPAEKVLEGADRALDIAVDASHLYWTDRSGRIQRVSK
ncbi:MAG: DUF5050 domain-containing protein [Myxococcales bacterium]|nr:DUF5050 domain-containing protein [Myxococcales bacterium]